MKNKIHLTKPKLVDGDFVCVMFLGKDKSCLCSESGYCSDILTLLWSWCQPYRCALETEWCLVVPGNQAGPAPLRLVVST